MSKQYMEMNWEEFKEIVAQYDAVTQQKLAKVGKQPNNKHLQSGLSLALHLASEEIAQRAGKVVHSNDGLKASAYFSGVANVSIIGKASLEQCREYFGPLAPEEKLQVNLRNNHSLSYMHHKKALSYPINSIDDLQVDTMRKNYFQLKLEQGINIVRENVKYMSNEDAEAIDKPVQVYIDRAWGGKLKLHFPIEYIGKFREGDMQEKGYKGRITIVGTDEQVTVDARYWAKYHSTGRLDRFFK